MTCVLYVCNVLCVLYVWCVCSLSYLFLFLLCMCLLYFAWYLIMLCVSGMFCMFCIFCMFCMVFFALHVLYDWNVIEESLEVKIPTRWTDEKKRWEESEKRREEKKKEDKRREIQKKEIPDARKGRKVAKHSVFQ